MFTVETNHKAINYYNIKSGYPKKIRHKTFHF